MLKINKVIKKFDNKTILDELSLDINDGSIFGLVGVNGAGKSTLLRSIAGVYLLNGGQILFENKDTYFDELVRKDIFLVGDDIYFPFAANIASLKQFYKSYYQFDELAFYEALNMFGLNEHQAISSFSKGMKRQVFLCFALAIKPKLLLLDEAFDGLDPLVRFNLKKALSNFVLENKAIIIISSHNLKELEDICDTYGILENGKIATYGDLLESKANINKYQIAFKQEPDDSIWAGLNIMHKRKEGSIYSLVIKGDKEEIVDRFNTYSPLILDTLPVNFEELFIYEHEGMENA